jgi:hypothetical protein
MRDSLLRYTAAAMGVRCWLPGAVAAALIAGSIAVAAAFDSSGAFEIAPAVAVITGTYYVLRCIRYLILAGSRSRMRAILWILALGHLAGLAAYQVFPMSNQTGRSIAEEVYGVDFLVFPAIMVLTGALAAALVLLRYRGYTPARGADGWIFWGGTFLMLVAFAAGMSNVVRPIVELRRYIGADLPGLTQFVASHDQAAWALPAMGLAFAALGLGTGAGRSTLRRIALNGQVALLVLANAGLVAWLAATFLPHYTLCGYSTETGFTRLHAAAMLGRADSVTALLGRGYPRDAPDSHGRTPLAYSIIGNRRDAARALLAAGARSDVRDWRGDSALHMAVSAGDREAAILLLDYGADINVTNAQGLTPLDLAESPQTPASDPELLRLLAGRGARRSTPEERRKTAGVGDKRTMVTAAPSGCKGV